LKKPTWIGTGEVLPKTDGYFLLDFVLVLSNESQFLDVYRFFSIPPQPIFAMLCFCVIMRGNRFDGFPLFCIFVRKLVSVTALGYVLIADMLEKHSYLSEVIFAGSLHLSVLGLIL